MRSERGGEFLLPALRATSPRGGGLRGERAATQGRPYGLTWEGLEERRLHGTYNIQ